MVLFLLYVDEDTSLERGIFTNGLSLGHTLFISNDYNRREDEVIHLPWGFTIDLSGKGLEGH